MAENKQNEPTMSNAQVLESTGGPGFTGENSPPKSGTSDRKKQSNAANAKYSTGPKTIRGKDAVRLNALKHGFYSTDVVIRQGDGRESLDEYNLLFKGLERSLQPTGVMQYCLVRTIVDCEWRLRRARRAEVGQIRRHTDTYYARLALDFLDDFGIAGDEPKDTPVWSRYESKDVARRRALEMRAKLNLLVEVRKDVEQCGYVSQVFQQKLDHAFGKDDLLASTCYQTSSLVQRQQAEAADNGGAAKPAGTCHLEDAPLGPDDFKQSLLGEIDSRIARLKLSVEDFEHAEEREHEAILMTHNLPSKEFIDTLIRYETALERRKEKALDMLLKLQANG